MPSHFSSLGFLVESEEQFQKLAELAAHAGTPLPLAQGGCYVRWSAGEGVELWVQANDRDEIVGVNPFFAGDTRMRVGLLGDFRRDDDWPLDGSFHAVAEPNEREVGGETPLVFDAPDAHRYRDLPFPCLAEASLVVFAHGLAAWPTEGAFRAGQEEFRLRVGSLVALGLDVSSAPAPEGAEPPPPEAFIRFSGLVRAAAQRENPFSGGRFQWASVELPGGAVDVVADIDLLDGEVVPGGVVAGTGWLCGRIVRAL
jgi:hypothetical protein